MSDPTWIMILLLPNGRLWIGDIVKGGNWGIFAPRHPELDPLDRAAWDAVVDSKNVFIREGEIQNVLSQM